MAEHDVLQERIESLRAEIQSGFGSLARKLDDHAAHMNTIEARTRALEQSFAAHVASTAAQAHEKRIALIGQRLRATERKLYIAAGALLALQAGSGLMEVLIK